MGNISPRPFALGSAFYNNERGFGDDDEAVRMTTLNLDFSKSPRKAAATAAHGPKSRLWEILARGRFIQGGCLIIKTKVLTMTTGP